MTLADCARYVVNDALNRTVYDMDSMLDTLCPSHDSAAASSTTDTQRAPHTAPSAATPHSQNTPHTAPSAATPHSQNTLHTAHSAATPDDATHAAYSTPTPEDRDTVLGVTDTQGIAVGNDSRTYSTDLAATPAIDVLCSSTLMTPSSEERHDATTDIDHSILSFESRFECGNLRKAIQVS